MPDWPTTALPAVTDLQEQLRASQEENLLAQEAIADLAAQLEDRGWRSLTQGVADEFTPEGRRRVAGVCRMMAVSNPLVKRALTVRIGYIWGQGVEVTARVGDELTPDQQAALETVNELLDDFEDDNETSLTGTQAREELERALGTDGNVYLAAFTSPLTGRVQVRSTPADEIVDVICNPEDRDDPWFYVREYVVDVLEAGTLPGSTRVRRQTRKTVHPALGYRPSTRVRSLNGVEVRWDAPVLHVAVNRLDGWKYGIPDAYAAVAWARMYRDFLVDWAGLTKSLSKIAWKATGDTRGRAAKAAAAAHAQAARQGLLSASGDAGGTVAAGPGNTFEAVSKSGATIDSESGKPLAAMVAAGMGVPVTLLLADPGTTGARAVAETLDKPTILEMGMRRLLWESALSAVCRHVITAAVEAPRGRLDGTTIIDDWGRKHTALAGGMEPVLDFTWPPLADLDPIKLVEAIVAADGTGKMPPVTTARLLLQALGVKDVDDVLAPYLDPETGEWIDPDASAGDAAVQAFRRGDDPATAVR